MRVFFQDGKSAFKDICLAVGCDRLYLNWKGNNQLIDRLVFCT